MEDPLPVMTIQEITPLELAARLRRKTTWCCWTCANPTRSGAAKSPIRRVVYAPMSDLARKQTAALPPEVADPAVKLVVFCHVGQRSAQVTFWLQDLGWQNVASLAGGIDAYARQVDPEIGFY